MDFGVMNALAHSVTAVGASWSRSQEWLLCARVLRNSVHHPQPVRAASADVNVVDKQCAVLQKPRFSGNLEQPVRVGGRGRFSRTQG